MRIVVDKPTVKAGRVTLRAVNQSRSLVHEVIVARDDGAKPLPMDAKQERVTRAACGDWEKSRTSRRGRRAH